MCSLGVLLRGHRSGISVDDVDAYPVESQTWRTHGLCALPDVLLCHVLEAVSTRTGGLSFSLVCRAFRDLSPSALVHLRVRQGASLPPFTFLHEAAAFPSLTSLHLPPSSLLSLDDLWLVSLPRRIPRLQHLSAEKGASLEVSASHRGLSTFFLGLPGLASLSLPDLGYAVALPDSVGGLPHLTTLQCMRLKGPLPDTLGGLISLKVLHLSSNTLQELPPSVSLLTALTSLTLDLMELQHVAEESVRGWEGSLRECRITSRVLWYLPEGITRLTSLTSLSLACRDLQDLPSGLEVLPRLQHMELFSRSLLSFPHGFSSLVALRTLEAGRAFNTRQPPLPHPPQHTHSTLAPQPLAHGHQAGMVVVPPSQGWTPAHEGVVGQGLGESESAPEETSLLPGSLHTLLVSSFWGQELPDCICSLPLLHTLSIQVCPSLRSLPPSLGKLTTLRELSIDLCALETLPDSVCQLKALKRLSLSNCASFRCLPHEFGALSGLTELRIEGCSNLQGFPSSLSRLHGVRILCLVGCHSLRSLPLDVGDLRSMRSLDIVRCRGLEMLPHSIGDMQTLQRLVLEDNSALTTLPESVSRLTALTELQILGCSNLARVPLGEQQMMLLTAACRSQIQRSALPSKKAPTKVKASKSKWALAQWALF